MPSAQHFQWSKLSSDAPMALLSRRRVMGEKMMVSEVTLETGCTVPVHHHENEQISCVLTGYLRFTVVEADGTEKLIDVRGGEVLLLPSHIPHGVVALEHTVVLDLFSPPSATTGIDKR
jgi:quercetin dioxygenase-like cupin family protein